MTTGETVIAQYKQVPESLQRSFPAIPDMLDDAFGGLIAFAAMPREHWQKIWSNNPTVSMRRLITVLSGDSSADLVGMVMLLTA